MVTAAFSDSEEYRLLALEQLEILDSQAEEGFDSLVKAAALVCEVPVCLISLVDKHRQWFKSNFGFSNFTETPRDIAFCAHTILQDGLLEVKNALKDKRFYDNPLVLGDPHFQFYAGAPLVLSGGARVGTLCIFDREPRTLNQNQKQVLLQLAKTASQLMELRATARNNEINSAQFRDLSSASPMGIFATDLLGICTYNNAAWLKIFNISLKQSIGSNWAASIHPEDAPIVFEQWQAFAEKGEVFDAEFRIQPIGGDLRVVHSSASKIMNSQGKHTGYVGAVKDITKQSLVGYANHSLLGMIKKHFMVAVVDLSGHITDVNDAFCDFNGYSRAELIGQHHNLLNSSSHPESLFAERWLKVEQGESWQGEISYCKKNGKLQWVDNVMAPLKGVSGPVERYVSVSRDISQRKNFEEQLRKNKLFLDRTGSMAGVGGWEVDLVANTVYWSDEICRIHGEEPGYAPSFDGAIHYYALDSRSVITNAIDSAISTGKGWDLELQLIRKDGALIWVRAIGSVEFELTKPIRLIGAFQEITETVKTRQLIANIHERMLQLTKTAGGVGVWEYDVLKHTLVWDELMYRLCGVEQDDTLSARALSSRHLHPDDRKIIKNKFQTAIINAQQYDAEFRIIWTDKSVHTIKTLGHVERDATGAAQRVIGVSWDVTHEREIEAVLVEQNELLRITMQSIGDAVITTNAKGEVTWLNPVAERMTGWGALEAHGCPLKKVFHIIDEQTRLPLKNPIETYLQQDQIVCLLNHTLLISRKGIKFGIEHSAAPIRNAQGVALGAVVVFRDVTEQRRLASEMKHRATHDELTGLFNRGEFDDRLSRLLEKSSEDGSIHTLLYIDLDEFKLVNDACGHTIGDQLLKQISSLMGAVIRDCDTLARLGGDEFGIILEHCSGEQAQRVAQQVCDHIGEFRLHHDGKRFRVSSSIGLVELSHTFTSTISVMQAADTCCYAAKEGGRNRIHTWIDNDQAIKERRHEMQWTSRIEQALDEDRFVLYAQRLHSLEADTQGIHAEVLLRMLDNNGSIISPAAFLPAAERFHLASRIDRWVLNRSIAWLKALGSDSPIQLLAINLSGQSVGDMAFHRSVMEYLVTLPATLCKRLCFEITETAAVTNLAAAALFIEQVRALGISVALDDFGAGASSFGYLKRLRVDYLKIDGQFITNLLDDALDDVAVRCFVDLAKVMNIKTIAEYVDKAPVLERIKELGVDYAQGFFLHKPEPINFLLKSPVTHSDGQAHLSLR
ncbi:Cyclic di-GMP phosphodiesterase PdeB [Polaromonas vacuolata]|uniref:Cyclic di-GMP phosphodiesterase PdeB n=1 Tax=Polaromonas vacuolata TaxID=37448 RepID=A0A6H2HDK2_9BURK|nr:EAL domain-containing protein [Polaromonas vacuolata]QJC57952.1 Cyclic di-GMP phosphodiesterase PdeB [Polaromonas vacuolata]